MTISANTQASGQVDLVQLTFGVPQARELAAVLPWVLQALRDRPGLTAKQRRRRELTQTALQDLLGQLTGRLDAQPTPDAQRSDT